MAGLLAIRRVAHRTRQTTPSLPSGELRGDVAAVRRYAVTHQERRNGETGVDLFDIPSSDELRRRELVERGMGRELSPVQREKVVAANRLKRRYAADYIPSPVPDSEPEFQEAVDTAIAEEMPREEVQQLKQDIAVEYEQIEAEHEHRDPEVRV